MPDLTPGVPSALSPLVRRIVAPNPGPMTGPGTNTYLVGIDEVAVIDPGPDDAKHIDAIVGGSMRERVRWVLLTHTHPDHSPGTERLVKATGAEVLAHAKVPKKDQPVVTPDRFIDEGAAVEGTEFRLEVLHTPGHAPNHLCFYLDEERVLFTGDTILDGTTSVISPARGGDMVKYLASLERLRKLRLAKILPGHGDVIEDPRGPHRRVPRAPRRARGADRRGARRRTGQDLGHRRSALRRHSRRVAGPGCLDGAGAPHQAADRRPRHRPRPEEHLEAGLMATPVVVVRPPNRQPLVLLLEERVEVGRECDGLIVPDSRMSRRHVALEPLSDGSVRVSDLGELERNARRRNRRSRVRASSLRVV